MKLKKIITVEGTMTAESGIHVGGNNDGTKVGGSDNPVIRNPINGKPYIPGSSVKGIMRYRMEQRLNKGIAGEPCRCGEKNCPVCRMFGAHRNTQPSSGESRLRVFDMQLDQEFEKKILDSGMSYYDLVEIVASTAVNRNTGTATGGLRNFERVAAGTKFKAKFILKVFEGDNERELLSMLEESLNIIEDVGIGARTSTGSGSVKFDIDWEEGKGIFTEKLS